MFGRVHLGSGSRALGLSVVVFVGVVLYAARVLPERVASHYDLAGRADGFSDRGTYLATLSGVCLALVALFALVRWLLPRLPNDLINLPHKDYWLAPDRRAASLQRIGNCLSWIGVATVALMTAILGLTIRSHRGDEPQSIGAGGWGLTSAYLVVVLAMVIAMAMSWSRRPA
ncbi:MAG: DUF1648 domain-containing protein [Planctomycetota bacterium]